MKKNFAAVLFLLAALLPGALPCRAKPAAPPMENRFLFIVDTASAMRRSSNAVVQSVVSLLQSDMKGEFREGDTLGLWTYNDKLHLEFPMQVWSKGEKDNIVAGMGGFLLEARYQKRAHFDKVMPVLNQVIKDAERLTIILIFDGDEPIKGTPFDKDINSLEKKYAREMRDNHIPFILVLAARNGTIFDYSINYAGSLAIPHTANPEKAAVTNAPLAVIPATNAPARPRHSIIMSGTTNMIDGTRVLSVVPPSPAKPPPAPQVIAPPPPVTPPPQAVVAMPSPQPAPAPVVVAPTPMPAKETPPPPAPPVTVIVKEPQPAPAPPVARAIPAADIAPPPNSQLALFVIAFSLLTIAVVLVLFLLRRARHTSQPSLITQSIDRPR